MRLVKRECPVKNVKFGDAIIADIGVTKTTTVPPSPGGSMGGLLCQGPRRQAFGTDQLTRKHPYGPSGGPVYWCQQGLFR